MSIDLKQLARFSPLNTLNKDYLMQLATKVEIKKFPKGSILFKRNHALKEKLFLLNGQVDLIDSSFKIIEVTPGHERSVQALNNNEPLLHTGITKTPVELISIASDFLDLVMAWSESGTLPNSSKKPTKKVVKKEDELDWMSSLIQAPLFEKLPPANIRQLFSRFLAVDVAKGQKVILHGERGDFFYVIESGTADVLDSTGKVLATLSVGNYFGEEALVGDTTRNATVMMRTDGKVMQLGKEDFVELLAAPVQRHFTGEELKKLTRNWEILDVRLPLERKAQSVAGSRGIPLKQLRDHLKDLKTDVLYVVTDDSGRRANIAVQLLTQAGFEACILQNAVSHYPQQ
jgi:signal-transduction protein with cAMP-binding, CBS, and nucleotidyltransferase domain